MREGQRADGLTHVQAESVRLSAENRRLTFWLTMKSTKPVAARDRFGARGRHCDTDRTRQEEDAMSGGSYDYAYSRMFDFVVELEARLDDGRVHDICVDGVWLAPGVLGHAHKANDVFHARVLFLLLARQVADIMRTIEWVDSGDKGVGDEVAPIRELLRSVKEAQPADALVAMAIEADRILAEPPKSGWGSADESLAGVAAARESLRQLRAVLV